MSLLSALETKEPAPSARVPPSQGWAPDLAPPPLDPRLETIPGDGISPFGTNEGMVRFLRGEQFILKTCL